MRVVNCAILRWRAVAIFLNEVDKIEIVLSCRFAKKKKWIFFLSHCRPQSAQLGFLPPRTPPNTNWSCALKPRRRLRRFYYSHVPFFQAVLLFFHIREVHPIFSHRCFSFDSFTHIVPPEEKVNASRGSSTKYIVSR